MTVEKVFLPTVAAQYPDTVIVEGVIHGLTVDSDRGAVACITDGSRDGCSHVAVIDALWRAVGADYLVVGESVFAECIPALLQSGDVVFHPIDIEVSSTELRFIVPFEGG